MVRALALLAVVLCIVLLPAIAHAQASVAGQARDASGAVLPGVTAEASSPALIEKVRSVVTGEAGRYRIELLPPGTYTLTFTLPGFATVRREGIELSGTFNATIDAELRVGAVEETVTVTTESPVVDVQAATHQRVVDRELIDTLPAGRTVFAQMALVPGASLSAATNQDVGGATNLSGAVTLQIHGSTQNSQLLLEDGLTTALLVTPNNSQLSYNMAATQEVAVNYSAAGAENNGSGVQVNAIPREGGNTFNGTLFVNGTWEALQGSNFSQRLQAAGLRTPDSVRELYDINPGFGGPLKRDKLWFYWSGRHAITSRWAAGEFYDKNANNPNVSTYDPDLTRPVSEDSFVNDGRLRLTWQAAPKLKIGGLYVQQTARNWPFTRDGMGRAAGAQLSAYEASPYHHFPVENQVTIDVTSELTNRLLLDGAIKHSEEHATRDKIPGLNPLMIAVLEQSTGREYRARSNYIDRPSYGIAYRAAAAYITGPHSFKVGLGDVTGHFNERDFDNQPVSYRFNNGVPNQITMRAYPILFRVNVDHQFGAYAQDRWTIKRLTLNLGLRYDWFHNSFPTQQIGPAPLAPARNFSFRYTDGLSLHDLNPKLSAAYDLFGNGTTALRVSLNRSVEPYTSGGLAGALNPINRLANSTTRSWTNANLDYVPHCNLLDLNANGECGAAASRNFGSLTPEQNFDPKLFTGWGHRFYDWEFTAGVQREIVPRVSVDFTYFRRSFGNFAVTKNRAVSASDFDTYSITAPADHRLPRGGSYVISGLYDVNPAKFGQTDNITTFAKNYGKELQIWNGIALTLNARLANGILVQGGFDAGTMLNDACGVRTKLPETLLTSQPSGWTPPGTSALAAAAYGSPLSSINPFCRTSEPAAQFKMYAVYTIPKIAVQLSSTFQNIPGPEIMANYTATNAIVASSLGRNLAGGATNVVVNLIEPGKMYGDRLNQLDLRFGKIVRLGERAKATLYMDVYNLLNVDTPITVNNAYASWLRPQSILLARFAKPGVRIDF